RETRTRRMFGWLRPRAQAGWKGAESGKSTTRLHTRVIFIELAFQDLYPEAVLAKKTDKHCCETGQPPYYPSSRAEPTHRDADGLAKNASTLPASDNSGS